MIAILSLLIVVTVSILVTRVASIALTHTGLSREAARFQARSAFTGAGFTTSESEQVVNHPVRRRIVLLLMLLGNAGIVTAVSSLILTFIKQGESSQSLMLKVVLLVGGLLALWALAHSRWIDRHLSRLIDATLNRYTRLDVKDYASLMQLVGEYRLAELQVQPDAWMSSRLLADTKLRDEGALVLGIHREDGTYLGAPRGKTEIKPGDKLLLYGRRRALEELDCRKRSEQGDREHEEAVEEQRRVTEEEERKDSESQAKRGVTQNEIRQS
jgi:K+/H+ antiporter YhaU regulatory subunit KhtT